MLITRWLRRQPTVAATEHEASALWGRQRVLSLTLDALTERVEALEHAAAVREAEHAAAMDSLNRLYRRVAARIARESPVSTGEKGESVLELKTRLGR